jgi:Trk-type K+ transport system membrane component
VATEASAESEDFFLHWKKILGKHNVSRSGQFYDLSEEEREHLGGCEYRALKILFVFVPLYSAMFQFFGAVALACWIGTRSPEIPQADSQNPWWTGIFYSVSAFNNAGFTLIDDSVVPFRSDYFVLFVMGLLILAGNTAYPVFLRLGLWSTLRIMQLTTPPQAHAPWKETLEFILKYPRRVYTTLFPARATWWLVGVLFVINIVDWIAFEILNIGNPNLANMSVGDQIVAGLFQAICKLHPLALLTM